MVRKYGNNFRHSDAEDSLLSSFISKAPERTGAQLWSAWYSFNFWANNTIGYFNAHKILNLSFNKNDFFKAFLKDFIGCFVGRSPFLDLPKGYDKNEIMVLSWSIADKVNLTKKKKDVYFGDLSADKNMKILRIYSAVDTHTKRQIDEVLASEAGIIYNKIDLLRIPRTVFILSKALLRGDFSLNCLLHYTNRAFIDAILLSKRVEKYFKNSKIKKVYLPYEGQPFQNKLIYLFRAWGVEVVGYLHSTLPALPVCTMFHAAAPRKILAHGTAYIELLENKLGWPKNSVEVIDSFRYTSSNLQSYFYLSYSIPDEERILGRIKLYLTLRGSLGVPMDVKIHPAQMENDAHRNFARRVSNLLRNYRLVEGDVQIWLCGVSSVLFEALERGIQNISVVCFFSDANTEVFDPKIFPNLDMEIVGEGIAIYKLKEKGSYIRYSEDSSSFISLLKKERDNKESSQLTSLPNAQPKNTAAIPGRYTQLSKKKE